MSQTHFSSSLYDFCQLNLENHPLELARFLQQFGQRAKAEWENTIALLKDKLSELPHLSGSIILNAPTPSDNLHSEAVILYRGLIFVLKIDQNSKSYAEEALTEVYDQARAYKEHHPASGDKFIIPVLLATAASPQGGAINVSEDLVANTMCDNGAHLAGLIEHFANQYRADEIAMSEWLTQI